MVASRQIDMSSNSTRSFTGLWQLSSKLGMQVMKTSSSICACCGDISWPCSSPSARSPTKGPAEPGVQNQSRPGQTSCRGNTLLRSAQHKSSRVQCADGQTCCSSQDDAFLQNLLSWFQHENGTACDCAMLDMLRKLLQQPDVAVKLCSLGLVPALEMLRDTGSPEVQRSADRTLTDFMQANLTSACQPVSPPSQYRPRSRCQSNSPAPCKPAHEQQLSQRLSTFHCNAKHGRTAAHSYSTDSRENISQAFGSQQGRTLFPYRLQGPIRPCQTFRHVADVKGILLRMN